MVLMVFILIRQYIVNLVNHGQEPEKRVVITGIAISILSLLLFLAQKWCPGSLEAKEIQSVASKEHARL